MGKIELKIPKGCEVKFVKGRMVLINPNKGHEKNPRSYYTWAELAGVQKKDNMGNEPKEKNEIWNPYCSIFDQLDILAYPVTFTDYLMLKKFKEENQSANNLHECEK